jgi:class 3 adenylate cyclase
MLASFGGQPGAAMAIRCAAAIRQAVRTLGLEIRMGVHTGDGEVVGEAAGGVAVHIGARIMPKGRRGRIADLEQHRL